MIDLHSHILPACDDGAADLETSLTMGRMAVDDGVRVMACTPHILPGLYENDGPTIKKRVLLLQRALLQAQVQLTLVAGADVHIAPDLPDGLRSGEIPTLNGSRYFLLEPPHQVVPPRFEELVSRLITDGFVPIITHPERLGWVSSHYELFDRVNSIGCLVQITAGSLTGQFGRRAKALAYRMLDEGRVDIIASDAHNHGSRPPGLSGARRIVAERFGDGLADEIFIRVPTSVLQNLPVAPRLLASRDKAEPATYVPERPGRLNRFVDWIRND